MLVGDCPNREKGTGQSWLLDQRWWHNWLKDDARVFSSTQWDIGKWNSVRILQAQWHGVILILKSCTNLNSVHSPGVYCCTAETRILQRPGLMCWKMRKVFTPMWFGGVGWEWALTQHENRLLWHRRLPLLNLPHSSCFAVTFPKGMYWLLSLGNLVHLLHMELMGWCAGGLLHDIWWKPIFSALRTALTD